MLCADLGALLSASVSDGAADSGASTASSSVAGALSAKNAEEGAVTTAANALMQLARNFGSGRVSSSKGQRKPVADAATAAVDDKAKLLAAGAAKQQVARTVHGLLADCLAREPLLLQEVVLLLRQGTPSSRSSSGGSAFNGGTTDSWADTSDASGSRAGGSCVCFSVRSLLSCFVVYKNR